MKLFATLVLFLVGMTTAAFTQNDVIVLKTGVEIPSKIVELTPKEVKYKELDNLDGPIITIDRATVFMLRYANGKTKPINPITEPPVEPKPIVKDEPQQTEKVEAKSNLKNEPKLVSSVSQLPKEQITVSFNKDKGFTGSVFIGGSLPLGDYTHKDVENNDKAAGAKLGFSGGVQAGYRFNKSLSLLCEAQFALNRYEIQFSDLRYIYSLRGDWTHLAVMPSIKFETPITDNFSIYTMALMGLSFTSVKGDFADVLKIIDTKTQSTNFGYGVTIGCVVSKRINLGIKYMEANPAFSDYKPTVSTLQATIGYQF